MAYRESPRVENAGIACFYCGSVVEGARCPSCAAEMQRALGPVPTTCRRCGGALARNSVGYGCCSCGGVLVTGEEWDRIVEALRSGRSADVSTIVPPPPGTPKPDLFKPMACAVCGVPMERAPFGARSGVLVDVCPRHGIWLDAGEIVPVLEFVRHLWKDNGGRILTPDEQRDAAAFRAFHKLKNELDLRAAEEKEEIERIGTRRGPREFGPLLGLLLEKPRRGDDDGD